MNEVAYGENLEGLQTLIENYFDVGEKVTVVLCLNAPAGQEQIAESKANLEASGVKVYSIGASEIEWGDGVMHPAVALCFARPAMAPADKIGFWPIVLAGVALFGAVGYVVYKGGEIAEDFMATVKNLIFPVILVAAGTYIVIKYMEKAK